MLPAPDPPGSGRFEVKTRWRPSGVQRGEEALKLGLVTRVASPEPSAFASRISLWRRFSSSRTEVTT